MNQSDWVFISCVVMYSDSFSQVCGYSQTIYMYDCSDLQMCMEFKANSFV